MTPEERKFLNMSPEERAGYAMHQRDEDWARRHPSQIRFKVDSQPIKDWGLETEPAESVRL